MRKFAMIALTITIVVAGSLVAVLGLADLRPAQASVPQDAHRGAGWSVTNFTTISFEEGQWDQLGQVGSCVIFRSKAEISQAGVIDPATLSVTTTTEEFNMDYPKIGARVIVCAGFTAFIPPLSQGFNPTEEP